MCSLPEAAVSRRPRILLRVAAGPRLGFGHLVRARTLTRALDADVRISVRGTARVIGIASRMALPLATRSIHAELADPSIDLVVIDDPSRREGNRVLRAARRRGHAVASIHDRGIAPLRSDLAIDGTICPGIVPATQLLSGPAYALLDPSIASGRRRARIKGRVLVTLGGGSRTQLARMIAAHVAERQPQAEVRLAGGWTTRGGRLPSRVAWLPTSSSLHGELRRCEVAVVAGGMTLYEAAAVGTPAVAVSIVPAQRPSVRAFSRGGLALDGGLARGTSTAARRSAMHVAGLVTRLLEEAPLRARLASKGPLIVDGRGAARVASALIALAKHTRRRR